MPLNLGKNEAITDPKKLVAQELKNAGFDIDTIKVPKRVYILADSLYDIALSKNCGTYKYPLGGELFVFNDNYSVGFIKGAMCSPAIATQAEDLIAGGLKNVFVCDIMYLLNKAINSILFRSTKQWTKNGKGYMTKQ